MWLDFLLIILRFNTASTIQKYILAYRLMLIVQMKVIRQTRIYIANDSSNFERCTNLNKISSNQHLSRRKLSSHDNPKHIFAFLPQRERKLYNRLPQPASILHTHLFYKDLEYIV